MGVLDNKVLRSSNDSQIYPVQFYDEDSDSMRVVSDTDPLPTVDSSIGHVSSASDTRPADATPLSANDVVGNTLTFANCSSVTGGNILVTGVSLEIDVGSVPSGMGTFRLHLYDSSPASLADNAAFNLPVADRTKYLGYIDIDTPQDNGDTLYIRMNNVNFQTKLATGSTSLYGILETKGAFTPTASAVKVTKLHILEV